VFGLGGSALTLVKSQVIGTTVSSVTVTDAFTTDYDAYRIIVAGGIGSTNISTTTFKLGAAASGYFFGGTRVSWTGTLTGNGNNNTTSWEAIWRAGTGVISLDIDLINPFLAKPTFINAKMVSFTASESYTGYGYHSTATSYTDFTMAITQAGPPTITGGTIYVYGYSKV